MNYTLILNMPDGVTTCRGCVMESWGSNFSIDTDLTEEAAVNKIAETFAEPEYGSNYTAHLIWINERNDTGERPEQVVYEIYADGGTALLSRHDSSYDFIDAERGRLYKLISTKRNAIVEKAKKWQKKLRSKRNNKN